MENSKLYATEPIPKLIFKFAVPCIASLLIGAIYNMVDQIFIGNSSLGYLGNAATGVSFPVICMCNAFAWCIGDGAAAFLSLCQGRGDKDTAHHCVGAGIVSSAVCSVLLMIVCLIFKEPLMSVFGASEQTLDLAVDYFEIIALFFPFYTLFNVMNGLIRADGSPLYGMISLLVGAILNLILDPIFIFALDWGIRGAAFATVIGQTVSFIMCAIYFPKAKTFTLTKDSFKVKPMVLKKILVYGSSTFIIQIAVVLLTVTSNMVLFHYGSLSIYGSDIPISVYNIQVKVYTLVNNTIVGMVLGAQPVLGYNYGAGRLDRVKESYFLLLKYSVMIGLAATAVFQFFPEAVLRIFGNGSDLYMDFGVKTFRIYLAFCLITALIKMTGIFFQSIGKPAQAMTASFIRDMICFIPLTLILTALLEGKNPGSGIYGILIAAPIADITAGLVVVIVTVIFFKGLNKKIKDSELEKL